MKINDFLEQAKIKYDDFFQYNKNSFNGMTKEMEIICPIHGIFKKTTKSHLKSQYGCQLCANKNKKKRTVFKDKEKKH